VANLKTLPVVYEDSAILAINKPAGFAVHKTHANDQHETLADILVKERPYLKDVGEDPLRPGIVHRLDKDTSGVMLIAKNQEAFNFLKRQFQERLVKKTYLALVNGSPREPFGTITATLGKLGTKQTTQLKGKRDLVEREAITDYKTLHSYDGYTLLEVTPHTGRTHQIRVHLKSIGCPIVGDSLYGRRGAPLPKGLDRMFLHAQRIEFSTPDGKRLALEVDLPDDLARALEGLDKSSL